MANFFTEFPEMPKATYRGMKKAIDAGYKDFAREWGDTIDAIFNPLLKLLVFFEDLLVATPWPIFMIVLMALTYWGSRSIKLCIGTFLAFVFIGYFQMWEETMSTIAIILTSVILAVVIGLPTGIAMSRSDRTEKIVTPILDIMQNDATLCVFNSHCYVDGYWKNSWINFCCHICDTPTYSFNKSRDKRS